MEELLFGAALLLARVEIPEPVLATYVFEGQTLEYGGDIRVGDLTGNGTVDLIAFRTGQGGFKPNFIAAFTLDGELLWQVGSGGGQPARPGPLAVYDINEDGKAEIITLFHQPSGEPTDTFRDCVFQIRDGTTGDVLQEAKPPIFDSISGDGPNWVHQRILICNLRGTDAPQDFIIKLGEKVLAFDDSLRMLWEYTIPWNEYSACSSYIPSVGDIDGDGMDEINGGYYLLDQDGTVLWEKQVAPHMDSVAIVPWDKGTMRAICSGHGHVLDEQGNVILSLGDQWVPHGQEVRVAHFLEMDEHQMAIRYNGHTPQVIVVDTAGTVRYQFEINQSPNNTGMEAVYWNGLDKPALLYNGGQLYNGAGTLFQALPDLPEPHGPARMAWYHCIPGDFTGDAREDIILYNPWDRYVYLYTPYPYYPAKHQAYQATPKQYNVRLMD